jgi:hypothetical protein
MPFCTECGARLAEDARFCTDCGVPVEQLPVGAAGVQPFTDSTPPGPETVMAVIPNLMRVRGLVLRGPSWHHLVMTSERIIVVQRTLNGIERFRQEIGVIGPDLESLFLKSMTPEQVLAGNPESRVIPLSDIVDVTVSKFVSYSTEDGAEPYWQVRLTTPQEVLKLRTDYHDDPEKHFRDPALVRLLGGRLSLLDA